LDKKDERKILSIKRRSVTANLGSPDRAQNSKFERFIDIHKKNKQWVPPLTKYNFTAE
jgi:hypothetical protein